MAGGGENKLNLTATQWVPLNYKSHPRGGLMKYYITLILTRLVIPTIGNFDVMRLMPVHIDGRRYRRWLTC